MFCTTDSVILETVLCGEPSFFLSQRDGTVAKICFCVAGCVSLQAKSKTMKNIVFDLGGVLFARDRKKCDPELLEFFGFLRAPQMPHFWEEYDRGTNTLESVTRTLVELTGQTYARCAEVLQQAIDLQEPIPVTEQLIRDLKASGRYRLYVLSNMAHEFIAHLRRFPVYGLFDGEVISCEELVVKPEPRIYEILLERYGLNPSESLFVDDREANVAAAERQGIHGFLFDHRDPVSACATLRAQLL